MLILGISIQRLTWLEISVDDVHGVAMVYHINNRAHDLGSGLL
jgi:hypothetical protein